MAHWTDSQRQLPAASFEILMQDVAWRMKIDFLGQESSYHREGRELPMSGFGSMLFCDYLELATKRALECVMANGLRLDKNCSTVAGIDMFVFRPFDLNKRSTHHARDLTDEARHLPRGYRPRLCFFCGEEAVEHNWRDGGNSGTRYEFKKDKCRAFMGVMVGPDPVPALLSRITSTEAAVAQLRQKTRKERVDFQTLRNAYGEAMELSGLYERLAGMVRPELFADARVPKRRKATFLDARVKSLKAAHDVLNLPGITCSASHRDELTQLVKDNHQAARKLWREANAA